MKVIDTFLFNGDWIVKLRLKWLSPFVDEFVIVESRYTFSGERKDILYKDRDEQVFRPYASKIHWIIVEDIPSPTDEWNELYKKQPWFHDKHKGSWFHEHYQRDAAVSYITETYINEPYMVHVSDVDEIPIPDIFHVSVREGISNKLCELEQPLYLEMLYCMYNFYWKKPYNWYRAFLITNDMLASGKSLNYWRYCSLPNFVLRDAGWHFSYFMEIDDIQRKIKSHGRYENEEWTDVHFVKECIAQGKDIFGRDDKEALIHDETVVFPVEFSPFRGEIDYLQVS